MQIKRGISRGEVGEGREEIYSARDSQRVGDERHECMNMSA